MKQKTIRFLTALASLLERHGATLEYTNSDDGIHVKIGTEDVIIGFDVGAPGESIREVLLIIGGRHGRQGK